VVFVAAAGVASLVLATRYVRRGGRGRVESGQSSPQHEEDVLGRGGQG
jgi:multicomponent Na+:H+ antiporter subunit A